MEVNLFHILGAAVVDELTADERRVIDAISERLSNDPAYEKKLQDELLQSQIAKVQESQQSAQQYKDNLTKSLV